MPTDVDILLVPKISDSTQLAGKSLTISDDTDGTPYRFSGDTINNAIQEIDDKVDQVDGYQLIATADVNRLADTSGENTGDQHASDFDIKDLTDSTDLRGTWSGKQDALGFTPENVINKKQTVTNSETDYPSGKAVYDALEANINLYNVTLAVPLTAGQYYTSTTARAAVPSGVRKRGLELLYETASGVWYCERFIGASVTTWTTSTDWEVVPNKKYVDDADALKENISNKSTNLTTDWGSEIKYASVKSVTDMLINQGVLWYGVSWDTAVSTTPMTRTGNAQMHRTLPIQSKMRGCLVSDSGTVTYLPATWSDATLDGSAGQVMVEIPEHYRYFPPANGTIMECRISEYPLPNFTFVPKSYISAYEATVARSTNKLSSVVNATAEYRGGDNSATNDANPNTLLGKPATVLSREQFRTYARNRGAGWEMLDYKTYNTLFWLYFVEYANTDSQLAVNSALDGNGYKQGGLGNGVTDIVPADWSTFNDYCPLINCGASNSLGNGSGEVSYTVPFTVPVTTKVNRYRGIENPFGHIWKNCDGIIFDVKTDADGGTSNIYICSVPSNYSDSITANYTLIGQIPRMEGFVKILQTGSFLPLTIGAGSTTYWCDYFYQSIASSSLRTLILGGSANNGPLAGLGYSNANSPVSAAGAYIGSRLCFFPQ